MKPQFLFFLKGIPFLKRQHRDWKVTVIRTSLDRLAYQTVFPYLSIYIVALGATATQLGMVNSLGMIMAGLLGPLSGWFIDNKGPKKIYLLGIGLLAVSYLTYGLAQNWMITIIAMVAYWLGFTVSVHSCATICGNCLANEDRATGMTFCETVAAGLLGMVGPMLAVWIVTASGGVNVSGIRPIFFLSLTITIGTFVIVLTQLSGQKWRIVSGTKPHLFRDLYQVVNKSRHLKRWLVITSIAQLPVGMVFPFSQVFAHEVKGADPYTLGAMVTGSAVASFACAIPLGRLADKVGRKKALYITIPLFWISNLILIWAPGPGFLIAAGVLQGFHHMTTPISGAMERELVPAEEMGRWLGIVRFFRMLFNACMAFLAGIIWDRVGPQYVFLTFVSIDLVFRMPLLIGMPETLNMRLGRQTPASSKG